MFGITPSPFWPLIFKNNKKSKGHIRLGDATTNKSIDKVISIDDLFVLSVKIDSLIIKIRAERLSREVHNGKENRKSME